MKVVLLGAVIFGVIGAIVGMPTGFVGYGTGLRGAFVFGGLGMVIGGLIGAVIRERRRQ